MRGEPKADWTSELTDEQFEACKAELKATRGKPDLFAQMRALDRVGNKFRQMAVENTREQAPTKRLPVNSEDPAMQRELNGDYKALVRETGLKMDPRSPERMAARQKAIDASKTPEYRASLEKHRAALTAAGVLKEKSQHGPTSPERMVARQKAIDASKTPEAQASREKYRAALRELGLWKEEKPD